MFWVVDNFLMMKHSSISKPVLLSPRHDLSVKYHMAEQADSTESWASQDDIDYSPDDLLLGKQTHSLLTNGKSRS